MRWVRSNRRFGAWAALFAFAVQLVLSFGHVHLPKTALRSLATVATQSGDPIGLAHNVPAKPDHDADDFCAICAVVGMVASSLLPEPALLVVPVAHPHKWTREFAGLSTRSERRRPFQARAPPHAA